MFWTVYHESIKSSAVRPADVRPKDWYLQARYGDPTLATRAAEIIARENRLHVKITSPLGTAYYVGR